MLILKATFCNKIGVNEIDIGEKESKNESAKSRRKNNIKSR
jgi:hypothetical protein